MPSNRRKKTGLEIKRAVYTGAMRRVNSLEAKKEYYTNVIKSGKVEKQDKKNPEQKITKSLTVAQVFDYKRKLEHVYNDLLLANNDLKYAEFAYKSALKKNSSLARGKRTDIKLGMEKNTFNSIVKMVNKGSDSIKSDLLGLKNSFSQYDDRFLSQIKSTLLKIIRKVNTSMPVTNLSKNLIEKLFNGISAWNGEDSNIMEVL